MPFVVKKKDKNNFNVLISEVSCSKHEIVVSEEAHIKLTGGRLDKHALVSASVEFLLKKEPNTSILKAFDIELIGNYFPDYYEEVSRWSNQIKKKKMHKL